MAASKQPDTTDQPETPLPEGWRMAVTPTRPAKVYYVSHNDCYTTWKDPRIYDSEPVKSELSVLEYIIRAYDYINPKPSDEDRQRNEFCRNEEQCVQEGNDETIRACMNALQEQIHAQDYRDQYSNTYRMASNTIKALQTVIRLRHGTTNAFQKLWFEFLLTLLGHRPGSCGSYIAGKRLLEIKDLEEYLEDLKGEELTRTIDVLKEWHFETTEDPQKSEFNKHSHWYLEYCTHNLIEIILSDNKQDRVYEPEFHQQFLDLYLFYFTKMTEVPDDPDFVYQLHRAMKRIAEAYPSRNQDTPYQGLQKPHILQKHLKTVGTIICRDSFREKHAKMAERIVDKIIDCMIKQRWTAFLMDDLIDIMKRYFLSDNGHMHDVFERILHHLRNTKDLFQENPQTSNKMLAIFLEILQKKPENVKWTLILPYIGQLSNKSIASKETAQIWFPLMKILMRTMKCSAVYLCYAMFREQKFKRMWNWKQNYQEALDIIEPIAEVHLHLKGNRDDTDILQHCGGSIRRLLEQFKTANVSEKLNGHAAELAMTFMEKRSVLLTRYFVGEFMREISLEGNRDVIPGLMKRFTVLFYDRDYMLDEYNNGFACDFMKTVLKAYSVGREIPDEVNKTLIEMFLWAMKTGDLEYIDIETGRTSLYGNTASDYLQTFVGKHLGRNTSENCDILLPLIPYIVKQLKHEDNDLKKSSQNTVYMIGMQDCKLLVGYLEGIVEWYRETQSQIAMLTIWKTIVESDGFTKPDFHAVMKTIPEDTHSQTYITGCVLKYMAEKQAELFTREHVDMMIRRFVDKKDSQGGVLAALGEIIAVKPEIFGENMLRHVLQNPNLDAENAFAVHVIAVNLGLQKEDLVNTIFDELLALAKCWHDPKYQIYPLDSIRILGSKYGVDTLKPHRKFFEDLQKFGMTSPLKDTSAVIVNAMDGIGMEGVVTDVIRTKKKVKVKKTETEVTGKETTVAKQSKDNEAVRAGHEAVGTGNEAAGTGYEAAATGHEGAGTRHKAAATGHEAAENNEDVVEKEVEETKTLMNPEEIEGAHQPRETQAGAGGASLEASLEGAAEPVGDDNDLPPSYNSLFAEASPSTQTTTKMNPKSPPQSSQKSPQAGPPPPPPYLYSHRYLVIKLKPAEEQKKKKSGTCLIS